MGSKGVLAFFLPFSPKPKSPPPLRRIGAIDKPSREGNPRLKLLLLGTLATSLGEKDALDATKATEIRKSQHAMKAP